MRTWLGWLGLFLSVSSLFVSCSDESGSDVPSGTGSDYVSESEPLFSTDKLMRVDVEIDTQDWNTLRYESPGLDHFIDPECPNGPRPRPFTWYNATVSVNGEDFGTIEIRKKGFKGSMEPMKPSIKLRFRDDHRAWGIRRMTLNNTDGQDPTWSRQCLAYHLFGKAGLVAPRCGLAQLTVNDQDLGIYTHVEEIRTPLLRSQFGDDGDGDLYELTGADFLPDLLVMFEDKQNNGVGDRSYLKKLADALEGEDYDQLLKDVGKYLDLDDFFTYWAMEVMTIHWDSYTGNRNNCYLYRDSTEGLFHFIPWGTDGTFVVLDQTESIKGPEDYWAKFLGRDRLVMPWAVYAHGEIARRLYAYPEGRARYETRLRELLKEVWDEDELVDMVDTIVKTISPELNDQLRERTERSATYLKEGIIKPHKSRILEELDSGLDDWDLPRNPPLCARAVTNAAGDPQTIRVFEGTIQAKFGTKYGEILEGKLDNPVVETAFGQEMSMQWAAGVVDYDDETVMDSRTILLEMAFGPTTKDGDFVWFSIHFPEELFYTGNTIRLDYGEGRTDAFWLDGDEVLELMTNADQSGSGSEPTRTPAGFVITGDLTLDEVDTADGGAVAVSFKAPLAEIEVP